MGVVDYGHKSKTKEITIMSNKIQKACRYAQSRRSDKPVHNHRHGRWL